MTIWEMVQMKSIEEVLGSNGKLKQKVEGNISGICLGTEEKLRAVSFLLDEKLFCVENLNYMDLLRTSSYLKTAQEQGEKVVVGGLYCPQRDDTISANGEILLVEYIKTKNFEFSK